MNLWSQGFWGAKLFWLKYPDHFFLYVVSAKDLTFCRLLFIFLGREQSQENSHLESFRTKVCYECGEMYAQTEDNADVFTKTTKIGEESEIVSGKKTDYIFSVTFSVKLLQRFEGFFVLAIEINGLQLTTPHRPFPRLRSSSPSSHSMGGSMEGAVSITTLGHGQLIPQLCGIFGQEFLQSIYLVGFQPHLKIWKLWVKSDSIPWSSQNWQIIAKKHHLVAIFHKPGFLWTKADSLNSFGHYHFFGTLPWQFGMQVTHPQPLNMSSWLQWWRLHLGGVTCESQYILSIEVKKCPP